MLPNVNEKKTFGDISEHVAAGVSIVEGRCVPSRPPPSRFGVFQQAMSTTALLFDIIVVLPLAVHSR
jgi:hypothetical protein